MTRCVSSLSRVGFFGKKKKRKKNPSAVGLRAAAPVRMRHWHFHYLPHKPVFHMGQAGVIIHLRECCCWVVFDSLGRQEENKTAGFFFFFFFSFFSLFFFSLSPSLSLTLSLLPPSLLSAEGVSHWWMPPWSRKHKLSARTDSATCTLQKIITGGDEELKSFRWVSQKTKQKQKKREPRLSWVFEWIWLKSETFSEECVYLLWFFWGPTYLELSFFFLSSSYFCSLSQSDLCQQCRNQWIT